jgi:hypothetical protein
MWLGFWLRKTYSPSGSRGLGWRRVRQAGFAMPLLLALGLQALPAAAQDAKELARARATFQQATELEQAGNWSAAVQKFREVGHGCMTPQVRFHIALCEDKLGRLVAALGGYELALADAGTVGPDFRAEVEGNVNRLRGRIPKLVIQRGAGAEAAVIELDGVSLGESSVGVDVPQDPGPHAVTAHSPNFQPFEATVSLAEGAKSGGNRDGGRGSRVTRGSREWWPGRAAPRKVNLVPYIVGGAVPPHCPCPACFSRCANRRCLASKTAAGNVCQPSERGAYSREDLPHAPLVTLGVGVAALNRRLVRARTEKAEEAGATAHGVRRGP